jgi:opacity protein-like surface antigen
MSPPSFNPLGGAMKIFLGCLALLMACAAPAAAQDYKGWRVYGGYQYSRIDTHQLQSQLDLEHSIFPTAFPAVNFGNNANLNGWNAGLEQDGNRWFSVVVDASGGYETRTITISSSSSGKLVTKTRLRDYTLTGGPQFTVARGPNYQIFVHALFGGAWYSDSTTQLFNNQLQFPFTPIAESAKGFTAGGGAGANIFFNKHLGVRIGGDYFRTWFFGDAQNNYRGTVGLVARF